MLPEAREFLMAHGPRDPRPPVTCMCGHGSGDHGPDGCLIAGCTCPFFEKKE